MELVLENAVAVLRPGDKTWGKHRYGVDDDAFDRGMNQLGPIYFAVCPLCGGLMHADMTPGDPGEVLSSVWCCHKHMGMVSIYFGFYGSKLPVACYDEIRRVQNGPQSI